MKRRSSLVGRFFTLFFRITLMLWGLFVPATAIQIYYNGKASVADPRFIDSAMIACFFIMIGAVVLAFLNALQERKQNDIGTE